ncbi:unnamed protein product [Prunus armeniaca]|uniref:Uncharacterized protein n=1 Tax=Prunus armeniaca TaxID=36596 RepID=A0A6J5VG86_PRUAR|nr:unnamed protein product [Prunus armeniaca]
MENTEMVCWCGKNARIRISWTISNPRSIGGVMDVYCNVILWREWWIRWTKAEDFGIAMTWGVLGMHCAFGMGSTVLVV